MMRFSRAAAFAAALTLPAALGAQARAEPARAAVPAAETSARAWMMELQQIQARLQTAHNRVMQDPQLRSQQDALMRDVKAAMLRIDAGLDALANRVQALETEGAAAQQRGDRQRLQQLNVELAQIQERFMRAQQRVMAQPAMQQRANLFERQLHARMLQAEPETDRLIDRGKDLQARLVRIAQQQVQGGHDE